MSNNNGEIHQLISTPTKRADIASDWIAKLDRGLSEQEQHDLDTWLAAGAENRQEFLAAARDWDRIDGLSRLKELFPETEPEAGPLWSKLGKVAAVAVLSIGLISLVNTGFYSQKSNQEIGLDKYFSSKKYETKIGGQEKIVLSDGTQLILNTNSSVIVSYTKKNRLLTLEKGEINLDVAHDPLRPLSVTVKNRVIQAVGTSFNIEITDDQSVELVVTDGLVMVGVLNDSHAQTNFKEKPVLLSPTSKLVAAGQSAIIPAKTKQNETIETNDIKSDDVAVKLSWKKGNLIFRGESLEEAVSEVGRYTAVEFVFLDEESKKITVVGLFKAGDVEGLLTTLHNNFNITYKWESTDKILLSAKF